MESHGSKAAAIVGKSTAAFTGNFNTSLEFSVKFLKFRYGKTSLFNQIGAFFSSYIFLC